MAFFALSIVSNLTYISPYHNIRYAQGKMCITHLCIFLNFDRVYGAVFAFTFAFDVLSEVLIPVLLRLSDGIYSLD